MLVDAPATPVKALTHGLASRKCQLDLELHSAHRVVIAIASPRLAVIAFAGTRLRVQNEVQEIAGFPIKLGGDKEAKFDAEGYLRPLLVVQTEKRRQMGLKEGITSPLPSG